MAKLYVIKDWEQRYETHESRRGKVKHLKWVALSNNMSSLQFKAMAERPDRYEIFSSWIIFLQLASQGPLEQRGRLERNGRPLTPEDIRILSGWTPEVIRKSLEYLTQPDVGWMEVIDVEDQGLTEKSGDPPEVSGEQRKNSGILLHEHNSDITRRTKNEEGAGPADAVPAFVDSSNLPNLEEPMNQLPAGPAMIIKGKALPVADLQRWRKRFDLWDVARAVACAKFRAPDDCNIGAWIQSGMSKGWIWDMPEEATTAVITEVEQAIRTLLNGKSKP
jgi:hypothetical protein